MRDVGKELELRVVDLPFLLHLQQLYLPEVHLASADDIVPDAEPDQAYQEYGIQDVCPGAGPERRKNIDHEGRLFFIPYSAVIGAFYHERISPRREFGKVSLPVCL